MIISKTPYRISFFGGGSDYPSWYKDNGGEVISTSINKYLFNFTTVTFFLITSTELCIQKLKVKN